MLILTARFARPPIQSLIKFEVLVMTAAQAWPGLEMIFPDIDIISRSTVVSREIELLILSPDVGLLRNVIQYLQS